MTATPTPIAGTCAGHPDAGSVRYLPASGAVVVLLHPVTAGWATAYISGPRYDQQPGTTVELSDRDVRSALPVDLVDPTVGLAGRDFARVWLARIYAQTRGGRVYQVARVLANQVREPGTRTVLLNDATKRRLVTAVYLRPEGLLRILARLENGQFLTPTAGSESCELTLPSTRFSEPPTTKTAGQPVHRRRDPADLAGHAAPSFSASGTGQR